MSDPRPLTRSELAEFLPTQRAIRAFENLFQNATQLPADQVTIAIQEASLEANSAGARAQQALDTLNRLAAAIEALAGLELVPPVQIGTLGEQQADNVVISGGSVTANLTNNQTTLLASSATLTNGAAASAGTLLNAPAAGNPTKWVAIDDNGTTRYIPAW